MAKSLFGTPTVCTEMLPTTPEVILKVSGSAELVVPMATEPKFAVWVSFTIRLLPVSETKISPSVSVTTPVGPLNSAGSVTGEP